MPANRAFIRACRAGLREVAVTEDAALMQAYMKSEMPYWGVKKPARAKVSKAVIAAHPLPSYAAWRDTARHLFDKAQKREERYCVLDLLDHRRYREYRERWSSFALYEHLIVAGAWWDIVDAVAIHHIGRLLAVEPDKTEAKMRAWIADEDLWRRRSAIICQIKFKAETDEDLLFAAIEGAIESKAFFLRKAIGWALREYGKTAPKAVLAYVEANEGRLSGLSKREALRRLVAET